MNQPQGNFQAHSVNMNSGQSNQSQSVAGGAYLGEDRHEKVKISNAERVVYSTGPAINVTFNKDGKTRNQLIFIYANAEKVPSKGLTSLVSALLPSSASVMSQNLLDYLKDETKPIDILVGTTVNVNVVYPKKGVSIEFTEGQWKAIDREAGGGLLFSGATKNEVKDWITENGLKLCYLRSYVNQHKDSLSLNERLIKSVLG
jgi:hypothetical protein